MLRPAPHRFAGSDRLVALDEKSITALDLVHVALSCNQQACYCQQREYADGKRDDGKEHSDVSSLLHCFQGGYLAGISALDFQAAYLEFS